MAKGKKIFVSYKHNDSDVQQIVRYPSNGQYPTARDYVDYLIDNLLDNEIYKGEGNEDLSQFKEATIETKLKDKIHDSSVTLVLISPNMKSTYEPENDQWIPWEISYSLKEITRNDRTSHTNAVLAVVLPNSYGSYSYYINHCNRGYGCNARQLGTGTLFKILQYNMFNHKENDNMSRTYFCRNCGVKIWTGAGSYIDSVKWSDFIANKDHYLEQAIRVRDNRKSYNITKEIQ